MMISWKIGSLSGVFAGEEAGALVSDMRTGSLVIYEVMLTQPYRRVYEAHMETRNDATAEAIATNIFQERDEVDAVHERQPGHIEAGVPCGSNAAVYAPPRERRPR
ncbi:hypothetical protein ABMY26_33925 [Azospirillum sp. HJ39]|uniref:hypothetical protein n=1 Tax=Azospirillum sp. HJ39 TaxID=3159496 RepID=UPI003556E8E5